MNNVIFSFLFTSFFVINVFADNEIKKDGIDHVSVSQKLNTLNERGYSPLHELIISTRELGDVPYYIQAIKSAERGWTYAYGDSWGGHAGDEILLDPVCVTWKADLYTKEDLLKIFLERVEKMSAAYVETIKRLVDNGADVNLPDRQGRTPLWWAAERNRPEIITTLIATGACVDGKENKIPLHIAACEGNKEAVEMLLAHGANPNLVDENGCTALHNAARGDRWLHPSKTPNDKVHRSGKIQDYKDVITFLIKHGALTTIKNHDGLTPSALALKQQQEFYPEYTEQVLEQCIEILAAEQNGSVK